MTTAGQAPANVRRIAEDNRLGDLSQVFEMGLSDGSLFKNQRVLWIFEQGCVAGNHRDERHESWRWEDVQAFLRGAVRTSVDGLYRATVYDVEFWLVDGRHIAVTGASTGRLSGNRRRSWFCGVGQASWPTVHIDNDLLLHDASTMRDLLVRREAPDGGIRRRLSDVDGGSGHVTGCSKRNLSR